MYENAEELIKKCKKIELKVREKPDVANSMFKDIINGFIIQDDSFLVKWKEFFRTNEFNIKKIRKDKERILGIFPDGILESEQDYVDYAIKAFNTKNLFDKFPAYLRRYSELFNNS